MNSIDIFVKNWGCKQSMIPICCDDITELESKLSAILPESYKYLISTYGLVHTPNVLTKTCDLGVEISEVYDFLSLDDVYSLSQLYQMSGMPKGHLLFASNARGNMFCFKLTDCENQQSDIPVWFYDYDCGEVTKVSENFTAWLGQFNEK